MSSKECKKFISEFASRINDEHKLRNLAITLGVDKHLEEALKNNRLDGKGVSGAAASVLDIWKNKGKPRSDQEYLDELEAACDENSGLMFNFHDVYEEIYKKPFVRTQEKQNIPQASGSDDVDASPRKTKRGKRKRVDEEEDSGEEEDDFDIPNIPTRGYDPYSLEYDHLFKVVIINNEFFDKANDRPGTKEDERKLREVLLKINPKLANEHAADLTVLENKSLEDLKKNLAEVAKSDFIKYAYFMCIVLSHGGEKGISAVDSKKIPVRELTGYFKGDKCKTLRGKPKIFFVQACRGGEEEFGVEYEEEEREEEDVDEEEDDDDQNKLPKEADIFIQYSAPEGYKSLRNNRKGSRFIQCLCAALEKLHGSKHLLDIGTITNKLVSETKGKNGRKIVSQISSTLRKDFFLAN